MDIDMVIANINADQDRANAEKRNAAKEEAYTTEHGLTIKMKTTSERVDDSEYYDVSLSCVAPVGYMLIGDELPDVSYYRKLPKEEQP